MKQGYIRHSMKWSLKRIRKENLKIERQKILSSWGKDFHAFLSVHTLEIGYDVPEVGIEIILATTSNMNQVIQRIGRIVRVYRGKRRALIYVVYISETKDDGTLQIFREATKLERNMAG